MKTRDILDRLIAFDTVSHKSNLALVDCVAGLLAQLGWRLSRFPSPCGQKAGLYAEIGPERDGGLLLSGHTDVVPVDGQPWTRPPFKLTQEGDKLYGRGTTDMKGFVASTLATAIAASARDLSKPLAIVLSYDEEIGCVGLQQMQAELSSMLRKPSLCIVGEPTSMQVATGHKGKAAFQARFNGEAGHSALAPRFQNALHLASDFMSGLRSMQDEIAQKGPFDDAYDIAYSTLHVGKLSGGTALNIVPDRAEMAFELRHLEAENSDALIARFYELAAAFNAGHSTPRVEVERTNDYPGFDVGRDHDWVKRVAAQAGTRFTKVAFGTEAGILSKMGVPTLVCGPGSMEGQGHKADEYVLSSQLDACDRLLQRLVADL